MIPRYPEGRATDFHSVFVYVGTDDGGHRAAGMNKETSDRFCVEAWNWLDVRGDTVKLRAS